MGEPGAVRTIFIGGLPQDVSDRDLHLLFYEGGGCEAIKLQNSQGRKPTGQVTAFVQFESTERAVEAQRFANGMVFDPVSPGMRLRVEFARQDFRKMPQATQPQPAAQPVFQAQHQFHYQPREKQQPHAIGMKRQFQQVEDNQYADSGEAASSTLFVGALNALVNSSELREFCSCADGFVGLTMKGEGSPKATAWAEYKTPEHAFMALEMLATSELPSLGQAPNIEIARSATTGPNKAARAGFHPTLPGGYQQGFGAQQAMRASGHSGVGHAGGLVSSFRDSPGRAFEHTNGAGSPGSCTVFLGSIDADVVEQDIAAMASMQDGYVGLNCRGIGRDRATAWVQYDSHEAAVAACEIFQQINLPGMNRPPNVELARADSRRVRA